MDKINHVNRLVHYYELDISFHPKFKPSDNRPYRELFSLIVRMARDKHEQRYQTFYDKIVFVHEISVKPEERMIYGKLLGIRKDVFPEIMNTLTDIPRGIEAAEEEGIVETTHFAIYDNGRDKPILALEYNLYGCKINDFANYLERIGIMHEAVINVRYVPVVKNELETLGERIVRCAEFYIKIHKDNIGEIENIDTGIYSALRASVDQFHNDYASLTLNFDYKKKSATPEVNNTIFKFIRALVEDKRKVDLFDKLQIVAEDADRNNKLQAFDLLVDKVKSSIIVEKKAKHRSIISADMFPKMHSELIKKRLIR